MEPPSRRDLDEDAEPPFLEFLHRAQGTLPEVIAQTNLDTLNRALGLLFDHLRQARLQFEGGDERHAAFTALGAISRFVVLFNASRSEGLHVPVVQLQSALADLENNLVSPMLKPVLRSGRSPSGHARAALKGYVAGTVERLLQTGLGQREAHLQVAKLLKSVGARAERRSGDITATTVRHWCREVASDFGRHGIAALMYDSMFTEVERRKFSALPPDQARHHALVSLGDYVQMSFPFKNPLKPPS
jgi:hypothetical protein